MEHFYIMRGEIDGALLGKVGLDFQLVFGSNVRSDYRAREMEKRNEKKLQNL